MRYTSRMLIIQSSPALCAQVNIFPLVNVDYETSCFLFIIIENSNNSSNGNDKNNKITSNKKKERVEDNLRV